MTEPFAGQTVLVTGGSSGIGLATAQEFARQGARVIIVGRDEKKLQTALGSLNHEALSFSADLSTATGVQALAQQLGQQQLELDVLFVNAGASNAPELFDTTEAEFDAVINTNFKSAFFTVLHCFPLLKEGARVILTSSVGYKRGTIGDPLYAASKAAVRSLGRAQPEFLEKHIRVNTISYGAISTPMTSFDTPEIQQALRNWAEERVPLRRWATVRAYPESEIAIGAIFRQMMRQAANCIKPI